jgi:hypothetical protein
MLRGVSGQIVVTGWRWSTEASCEWSVALGGRLALG